MHSVETLVPRSDALIAFATDTQCEAHIAAARLMKLASQLVANDGLDDGASELQRALGQTQLRTGRDPLDVINETAAEMEAPEMKRARLYELASGTAAPSDGEIALLIQATQHRALGSAWLAGIPPQRIILGALSAIFGAVHPDSTDTMLNHAIYHLITAKQILDETD